MGTARKILLWAVGILMAIGFIGLAMNFYGKSTSLAKEADTGLNEVTSTLTSSKYTEYNNATVSGTQVINAIRLYATPTVSISVVTNASTTRVYYNDSTAYNITNILDARYIEPTGDFYSNLIKTSNGTVSEIRFTQQ